MDNVKLKEATNRSTAIGLRIDGAVKSFTAAVIVDDPKEQDRLRTEVHALLDAQLDALSEMGRLMMGTLK